MYTYSQSNLQKKMSSSSVILFCSVPICLLNYLVSSSRQPRVSIATNSELLFFFVQSLFFHCCCYRCMTGLSNKYFITLQARETFQIRSHKSMVYLNFPNSPFSYVDDRFDGNSFRILFRTAQFMMSQRVNLSTIFKVDKFLYLTFQPNTNSNCS